MCGVICEGQTLLRLPKPAWKGFVPGGNRPKMSVRHAILNSCGQRCTSSLSTAVSSRIGLISTGPGGSVKNSSPSFPFLSLSLSSVLPVLAGDAACTSGLPSCLAAAPVVAGAVACAGAEDAF